jgi:predicted nuclease with TOPRIM domain
LKVKAFEHTSLVSAHEGKTAEIADLTLHVEALKKQVAAHEVAFRTLEDSSSEAEQKWKLQLEEKCRALEVLRLLDKRVTICMYNAFQLNSYKT